MATHKNKHFDKETLERWHKDPNNWIWGIFYFNREDPRLLPPKRLAAMGWTVNFANLKSIFLMVFIVAFAFFILGFLNKK